MPTCAGGAGSSTFVFVSVSKSRIDPAERLLAWKRGDHGPQLRTALLTRQRETQRAQVPADRLQLAHDAAGIDAPVRTLEQLATTLQRLGRVDPDRRGRVEDDARVLPRL